MDTLALAREKHPGQKNSLDALCKCYQVDNAARTLHGALLDAEILADVYLAMTGGQATLEDESQASPGADVSRRRGARRVPLRVIAPSPSEAAEHQRLLDLLDKASGGRCVWRQSGPAPGAPQDARAA